MDKKLTQENTAALAAALPDYLRSKRWFRAKAYTITSVDIVEAVPLSQDADSPYILVIHVNYAESDTHTYVLLLRSGSPAADEQGFIASLPSGMAVYDATADAEMSLGLLAAIRTGLKLNEGGDADSISAWYTDAFDGLYPGDDRVSPTVLGVEQSNTSIKYGDALILKLFRRLEDGVSPELEIGRFLGEKGFRNTPPLAGAIEFVAGDAEPQTLAILQGFVPNLGDAWSYTLGVVERYFDHFDSKIDLEIPRGVHLLDLASVPVPDNIEEAIEDYLKSARLLGKRTAEMHAALASDPDDPAFAPEPFTEEYQGAMYGSMQALTEEAFRLLRGKLDSLPGEARSEAATLINNRTSVLEKFEPLTSQRINAMRTRVHGDYHLGQVLWTGSDFVIIDFEGEPVRSLQERRLKHSPLKDVSGMLRSFHYGAYSGMFDSISKHGAQERIEDWADSWHLWVSAAYLRSYLETAGGSSWLPATREDLHVLLDAHLLEKAVYEMLYEINMRPDWVLIPVKGILQLLT